MKSEDVCGDGDEHGCDVGVGDDPDRLERSMAVLWLLNANSSPGVPAVIPNETTRSKFREVRRRQILE